MLRIILTGFLVLSLSACFHDGLLDKINGDDDQAVDPLIFSPDLALESSFDELLEKPQIEIASTDELQSLVAKLLPRLISHLSVFNGQADLLPSSGFGSEVDRPVFKSQSRVYQILDARACEVVDSSESDIAPEDVDIKNLENKNSLFWDDADEDDVTSDGDRWIRLLSQCRDLVTNRFSTGTIFYTNIDEHVEAIKGNTDESIHDLGVSVRMQIDYEEGQSASSMLFNNFEGLFHRDVETGSHFLVKAGSFSSSASNSKQYAFEYDSASVIYTISEEFPSVESITFKGKYFDSELDGYISIDNLSIDLDYDFGDIKNVSIALNSGTDDAAVTLDLDSLELSLGEEESPVAIDEVFSEGFLPVIVMD